MGCMQSRALHAVLVNVVCCLVVSGAVICGIAAPADAAAASHRQVSFGRISITVPAAWPVISLSRDPAACPRLNRHAVYLGTPGPDPACPAELTGRTTAVQLMPVDPASPDLRSATKSAVIDGAKARTNPDSAITHTIIDIFPGAGVELSVSYGSNPAAADAILRSVRVAATGPAIAPQVQNLPEVAAGPAAVAQGTFKGRGFDSCAAPSAAAMKSWLASPYRAIGIYIGGVNEGCAQASLTSGWINTIRAEGWRYFPFYVGLQASCVDAFGDATIVSADATAEGKAAANNAVTQARNLGIPAGTPLIYDMEAYGNCNSQVVTFLSAWDRQLHADGYEAGVYESFSNVGALVSAARTMSEPDVIHYADWDGKATTASSYMPAAMWTDHQRLHQYLGGHNETWGKVTLNIDTDELNVNLGGSASPPVPTPTPPPGPGLPPAAARIAVGMNSNGTAEWFATAANGTILHAYQHPIGATTWAPSRTVGNSPANLVSSPAVAADSGGALTLFAVNAASQVLHAWQQAGAPNEWKWDGPAGTGSPGAVSGNPAAITEPGGEVGVFVTDSGGTVMTTHQLAPDGNTSWSPWTAIGGTCASSPVPFSESSSALAVACVTSGGLLAVSDFSGSGWSAWQTAGAAGGLTGTPAAAVAGGQAYLFAATSAGTLAEAYQRAGASSWSAGGTGSGGSQVQGSPSAIGWPGGGVAVFSELAGGQLGYAVLSGSGAGSLSAWTSLGTAMTGSPAAWTDSFGEPQAAVLTGQGNLAVSGYASSAWTPWTSLATGF
jgi:hypothetical protein